MRMRGFDNEAGPASAAMSIWLLLSAYDSVSKLDPLTVPILLLESFFRLHELQLTCAALMRCDPITPWQNEPDAPNLAHAPNTDTDRKCGLYGMASRQGLICEESEIRNVGCPSRQTNGDEDTVDGAQCGSRRAWSTERKECNFESTIHSLAVMRWELLNLLLQLVKIPWCIHTFSVSSISKVLVLCEVGQ